MVFVTPAFALSSEREGKLRIIGATSTCRISYAPAVRLWPNRDSRASGGYLEWLYGAARHACRGRRSAE